MYPGKIQVGQVYGFTCYQGKVHLVTITNITKTGYITAMYEDGVMIKHWGRYQVPAHYRYYGRLKTQLGEQDGNIRELLEDRSRA